MKLKYKILFTIYILFLICIWIVNKGIFNNIITDLNYVSCGSATGIPKPAPQLVTIAFTLLIVGAPIVLIAFSIITLIKAILAGNAEDVSKSRTKLIKKIIVTLLVYVSAALVQFVINKVASNTSDKESISKCLRCFLYYSDTNCPASSTGNDIKKESYKRTNENNSIGIEAQARREKSKKKSSSDDVILVGDSRTVQMCGFGADKDNGDTCKDFFAVAHGGKGADWFRDVLAPSVTKKLKENPSKTYDILILMGANDVSCSRYGSAVPTTTGIYKNEVSKLAKGDWKKHNVIFVMLPCGDESMAAQHGMCINQSYIDQFNNEMKNYIKDANIDNLDFCTIKDVPRDYLYDGVHYSAKGSEFYYDQIKETCVN